MSDAEQEVREALASYAKGNDLNPEMMGILARYGWTDGAKFIPRVSKEGQAVLEADGMLPPGWKSTVEVERFVKAWERGRCKELQTAPNSSKDLGFDDRRWVLKGYRQFISGPQLDGSEVVELMPVPREPEDSEYGPFEPDELIAWAENYGHPEAWAKRAQAAHAKVEKLEKTTAQCADAESCLVGHVK